MNEVAENPAVINLNDTVYDFSPEAVRKIRGMDEEEYQKQRSSLDNTMYWLVDIIRNG